MIIEITTQKEFEEKINLGVCLVDFWAEWCGPCRMLGNILNEVDNDSITIIKVNVEEVPELASQFNVQSIPHIVLFKNGAEVSCKTGFSPKSTLLKWIENSNKTQL
ncbi:MAG: thioredoxin [Holosporales bacterium]|jgi:thioredoxin 1|nr:thioredoxin [Holosporales bacterium]